MPAHPTGRPHTSWEYGEMDVGLRDAVFRIEKAFAIISQEGDDNRETFIEAAYAYFVSSRHS
jgi:hypothetical protein